MKIIYFGTDKYSELALDKVIKANNPISLVVTLPDSIRSRGNKKSPTPVKVFCEKERINFTENMPTYEEIKKINPDIIIVASYGKIIPEFILNSSKYGAINLHPSLLPKYRGPSPVQTALINGDKKTGTTIILLNKVIDGGPIICQEKYKIKSEDTYSDLIERLFLIGANNINKILTKPNLINNAKPQKEEDATHTKKIEKSDGYIDWNQEGNNIIQIVKALSEKPGTYSFIDGKKIKIHKVSNYEQSNIPNEPGQLNVGPKNDLKVSTSDGRITINELQLEGKKRMKAEDFILGYKVYTSINNERIYKKLS